MGRNIIAAIMGTFHMNVRTRIWFTSCLLGGISYIYQPSRGGGGGGGLYMAHRLYLHSTLQLGQDYSKNKPICLLISYVSRFYLKKKGI